MNRKKFGLYYSSSLVLVSIIQVFIFLSVVQLVAQDRLSIIGHVTDTNAQPIDFGDIVLLNSDSTVAQYSYIENGAFEMKDLTASTYIFVINALGYAPHNDTLTIIKDTIVHFKMTSTSIELDEVVVKARKKIFENENGNVKLNVSNTVLSAEPDPLNLLSKMPNIQINPNGESLSMVGRGAPLLYHNNQRIDLKTLSAINVKDIEYIEIINNPSVKYEAEGLSVIIIHTKRTVNEGYKIDLTETLALREMANNYVNINSSFTTHKLQFKVNAGLNILQPWEKVVTAYEVLDRHLESNSEGVAQSRRNDYILGTSMYYPFNEHDYLSVDFNAKLRRGQGDINSNSWYNINSDTTQVRTFNNSIDDRDYYNGLFNFNKKIAGGNLFFGSQYAHFGQDVDTYIENNYGRPINTPEETRIQGFDIESWTNRVDYETIGTNGTKVEIGLNAGTSDARSIQSITSLDTLTMHTTTDYSYNENIFAGYSQVSKDVGNVNISAGLRIEYADIEGRFANEDLLIDRNNTYLLPKAQLSMPIDTLSMITFNFSRNITRPNFSNLSQIEVYVNPFLVFSRNLNLKPTITNEIAATIQHKDLSFRLSLMENNDPIQWSTLLQSEDLFKTTLRNFDQELRWSATLNFPITHKAWTSLNTLNLNWSTISDAQAADLSSSPYLYFYTNHNIKLPKEFSLALTGWGFTHRNQGAYTRNALIVAGITLSRTFFDNLSCTVSYNNIFNNRSFEESSAVNSVLAFNGFFVDSRELSFTLQYSLGKQQSTFKNKKISEYNRVK